MGGGAFAQAAAHGEPTLRTPRMTPAEYTHLKATYLSRLQQHLPDHTVSVLVEAPEKTDYGDIDFIIRSDGHVDSIELARRVGAAGVICRGSGKHQACSLAVPKNGSKSERGTVIYSHVLSNNPRKAPASGQLSEDEYAQIDIEVVSTELFDWYTFYASYGDLGGLLGAIVRSLGFTMSNRGLILRFRELDDAKAMPNKVQVADKDGMLLLSNDPKHVMLFLGLSPKIFEIGFNTIDSFYEWLGSCRLIAVDTIWPKRNLSTDRQKEAKRSMFTRFFDEYLPSKLGIADIEKTARSESQYSDAEHVEKKRKLSKADLALKRQRLRDEAVKFFDKEAEFKTMHDALIMSLHNQVADRLLKPLVAYYSGSKDKKLNEIIRAFRRWVGFREGEPYIVEQPHTDAESQLYHFLSDDGETLREPQRVDKWVKEHWEELKGLERQWMKAQRGDPEAAVDGA